MRCQEDVIEIDYRDSQILRNIAREFKEGILADADTLVKERNQFLASFIEYWKERPLQQERALHLLKHLLLMEEQEYEAFVGFINTIVLEDAISIMRTYPLRNGKKVIQKKVYN